MKNSVHSIDEDLLPKVEAKVLTPFLESPIISLIALALSCDIS